MPVEDKTDELRRALSERKQDVDRLQRTIDHEKQYIADGETRLNDYRARWRAIDTEEFTETVCPTCHQPLPAEQVAEAREAFAAYQQQRKGALLEDSKLVKQGHCSRTGTSCKRRNRAEIRTERGAESADCLGQLYAAGHHRSGEPAGL